MAQISFKTKARQVYNADGTPAYKIAMVPNLARRHCDMAAFRRHSKYGGLANSDLFPNVLARVQRDVFGKDHFRLDQIPPGVAVDDTGFLLDVSFDV